MEISLSETLSSCCGRFTKHDFAATIEKAQISYARLHTLHIRMASNTVNVNATAGTGTKLTYAVIVVAGVASLVATLISFL